jgi:hypothetical protein
VVSVLVHVQTHTHLANAVLLAQQFLALPVTTQEAQLTPAQAEEVYLEQLVQYLHLEDTLVQVAVHCLAQHVTSTLA